MKPWLAASVLAGVLGATAAGGPALAQQVTWKVAIFGPPRAVTAPVEYLAREMAARTGGQLKIEPVYGEALSKATEIIDGLKAGAFEAGLLCASYYPGKLPLYTVLDLAMLTPDDIMAQARVQMAVAEHPAIAQEFKRWNVRMLLPGPLPQYQLMGKRRIARAEDLKGVRIRVSGEMARVLEDYGAVKSLVPAPETYTSLERGVVDMISFPSTYAFASYRLQEISKYFIDKISLGTQPCFWGVSETAWSKLSPAQQKLLLDLREPATQAGAQAYAAADAKNYADWKARGLEIIDFPAAERAKLTANAGKHWQEWVQDKEKKGLPGKALLEFVQAKIKEHAR
jgi:TRAP-type C4-dicarboxylate transport system substrate-binding protein